MAQLEQSITRALHLKKAQEGVRSLNRASQHDAPGPACLVGVGIVSAFA